MEIIALSILVVLLVFAIYFVTNIFINPDGAMVVNQTNPEKDIYKLVVYKPLDNIPSKKILFLKVVIDNTPITIPDEDDLA